MLNIGVLGPGSEHYYLGSVALGAEDYYLGGEVPGRWVGHGAEILGLVGEVAGEALTELLADRDPRTGMTLGCGSNRKVPAFDLTFSTPKSVSVLFGLSEPYVAVAVRDAHEAAVDAALGYLERHAVWSRRGRNGIDQVVGDGLVGAAFRHRTSRAGDPHLHTHVLVANTVRGPGRQLAHPRLPSRLRPRQDRRLPVRGAPASPVDGAAGSGLAAGEERDG